MAKELAMLDDDMGVNIQDLMMLMMVVVMASFMTGVVPQLTQPLQAQSYLGLTDSRTLNCTPTMQWINLISDPPYNPWVTASFFNYGPQSAFIGINNPGELTQIPSGGSYNVDMVGGQRRVELVFYKSNTGEKATVDVVAKY